jgi:hypothetical protein
LIFVENAGQLPSNVKFFAQGGGASVFFAPGEAVFKFVKSQPQPARTSGVTPLPGTGLALAMRFIGANRAAVISGRTPASGKWNHMVGSDPAAWRANLPTWDEVVYHELWPGVDAVFSGTGGEIKYDFVVQPGANAGAIAFQYAGATGLKLDSSGNLVIETGLGPLHDAAPFSYQEINGARVPVKSRYVLRGKGATSQVTIEVAGYDRRKPLVIDPALTWAQLTATSSSLNSR